MCRFVPFRHPWGSPNRVIFVKTILTIILIRVLSFTADVRADPGQEAALEVLREADAAIRSLSAITYSGEYAGFYSARGFMQADVLLARGTGASAPLGTTNYALRAHVRVADAPYGHAALPAAYTLVERDEQAFLMPAETRSVQVANGWDRLALTHATNTVILPQYVRPNPFSVELEQSTTAKLLGQTTVDGVTCHVVWLRFDPTTGLGEQLLYIGVEDHLLRRASIVSPESIVSEDGATNPTVGIDVTYRNLQVLDEVPTGAFLVETENLDVEIISAAEVAAGEPAPHFVLTMADGQTVTGKQLQGEVVVLVFWASWCPSCFGFLPEIQRLHENMPDVRVIAVNAFDRDQPVQYIASRGFTFEVALHGDITLRQFRFIGQPAVVVLDQDGIIRYRQNAVRPATEGNPGIWRAVRDALEQSQP